MKKRVLIALVVMLALVATASVVQADPGILYVDDDGVCGGNSPCHTHPQDAVNAANPGDTILVYPGTYGSRVFTTKPPHWGPNDQYAPALIVYKDGLDIQAVDSDPANTIIESTHDVWSNPVAIQASTGGTWDGSKYVGAGVNPTFGTAPNAVAVIASGVTIRGFTLRRHFEGTWATYNTAGVMIGGLCAGCSGHLGSNGNAVENCVFEDVWHAVYIWHSSDNRIVNNIVGTLTTNHWAAISTYDGYNDAQIELGHLSENNLIAHNTTENKGIALGAWDPATWTSNAGSKVCCNTTTQVGVTYAHGLVIIGCNTGGFWQSNTDNVLRITGVSYTGETLSGSGTVALGAQVAYDGTSDGSGVEVVFTVNDMDYSATTGAGGSASTTVNLLVGVYEVQAKVNVCDSCEFTASAILVVYDPEGGFVTGGGWIDSPLGEYQYMSVEGKATFGFVSKYKKGASVPEGNTQFQFKAGDLNFHSTSYDWLVVTGSDYAKFKGTGTINGEGSYKFMLWAGDDEPDTFRIKIWAENGEIETVVYDNGMDQPISGGQIVIHTMKK